MDDNARMIAAAKRKARRTAHADGITHQQALDRLARQMGREHWGAYMASPVAVPRDRTPVGTGAVPADADTIDMVTALAVDRRADIHIQRGDASYAVRLGDEPGPVHVGDIAQYEVLRARILDRARIDIDAGGAGRGAYGQEIHGTMTELSVSVTPLPGGMEAIHLSMPRRHDVDILEPIPGARPDWNALAMPEIAQGGQARETRIAAIAATLMPHRGRQDGYFDHHARRALEGFLMLEIDRAAVEGRAPSIPAMATWIRHGLRWSAPRTGDLKGVDVEGRWITFVTRTVGDASAAGHVAERLGVLVDMASTARSGILATMGRALMAFIDVTDETAAAA